MHVFCGTKAARRLINFALSRLILAAFETWEISNAHHSRRGLSLSAKKLRFHFSPARAFDRNYSRLRADFALVSVN
jgi:hypothetical protein